jgi:hypothetical protein
VHIVRPPVSTALSRWLHALSAGLTQLARPETVLGEVRFPLSPFFGIEVIDRQIIVVQGTGQGGVPPLV